MRTIRVSSKSGFTLFEVLIAASMTMIVMFGALYTTTESFEVAREGDRRIQSKVSVRRSMDRFLKDCRYAQDIAIQGDLESGWEVTIATAGSPEPMELSWKWNPQDSCLKLSDGETEDKVVENLHNFDLSFLLDEDEEQPVISQISIRWLVGIDSSFEAASPPADQTFDVAGSTWVRKNVPSF